MATLSFKLPADRIQEREINIDEWKYMANTSYHFGNSCWTKGTKIVLPDQTIDVMGYTPDMIREILYSDLNLENVIFTSNLFESPAYCNMCGGLGMIDWITNAMKNPIYFHKNRGVHRGYKRDRKIVMFYQQDKSSIPVFDRVFARIKVEKGYKLCKNCQGTGMALDARQRIFQGLPGLKRKLKAFEWDGFNIPG